MTADPDKETEVRAPFSGPSCPLPLLDHDEIVIGHGSGGKLTHQLVEGLIVPAFFNDLLAPLHDGATLSVPAGRIAMSTDSYVVDPVFFPGGDIGRLAVNGTVNDVAMCGARPLFLSVAFVLEEGFPMADLERVVRTMRRAADEAGVRIVTGDTKVVDRGKADRIFINTTGVGVLPDGIELHPTQVRPGDRILVSGEIATHGIAILSVREGLSFETEIESDTAPLNGLVETILKTCPDVRVLRDPTRGGLTGTLNEIAQQGGVGIRLDEVRIPVREAVRGACEILGLDPLHVANEGKLVAIVPAGRAESLLAAMRAHPLGGESSIIGEVTDHSAGLVTMRTRVGGERIVDRLTGEQLPRIC